MNQWASVQPLRWLSVAALLREQPLGSVVRMPLTRVEHPRDGGMQLSFGLPVGQRANYRLDVGSGQDLVVAEFAQTFDAHLEQRPALVDFEAILRESPGSAVVGMIALGAIAGLAIGRSKESTLVGAAIGGMAALAGVGVANAEASPKVTDAALRLFTAMQSARAVNASQIQPGRGASSRKT